MFFINKIYSHEAMLVKAYKNYNFTLPLKGLLSSSFRAKFKETPLWRRKRKGILRNACIALGNIGNQEHLEALKKAHLEEEPLIKEAAAWAITNIHKRLGLMPNQEEC